MRIKVKVHGRRKYARRKVRRHNIVNNCKSVYIHGKVYDFSKLQRYPNNNGFIFKNFLFPLLKFVVYLLIKVTVLIMWLEKQCPVKQCPTKKDKQKKKKDSTTRNKSTNKAPTSTNDTTNSTPPFLPSGPETHPTPEKRVRSKRGEHIINQDVLKVERKIFEEFLQKLGMGKSDVQMSVQSSIEGNVKELIESVLVVTFDDDEKYFDKNSTSYGKTTKDLRDAIIKSMGHYWDYMRCQEDAIAQVLKMISNELFVDKQALAKWLETRPSERFENVLRDAIIKSMGDYWNYMRCQEDAIAHVSNMNSNELFVDKEALAKWLKTRPSEKVDQAKDEVTKMFDRLPDKWVTNVVVRLNESLHDRETPGNITTRTSKITTGTAL